MDAFDVMTTAVIAVSPDTPTQRIAQLLLEHGISAVPVVDENNEVAGMVSEGDLLRFSDEDREARRDWWLAILAEGESLSPKFLATMKGDNRTAETVMSAPVVTVTEHTDVSEIGKLLGTYRIKRVPVLRDGRIVGIVSRADLIRALVTQSAALPHHEAGLFGWSNHREHAKPQADADAQPVQSALSDKEKATTASDFRSLVEAAASKRAAELEAARRASGAEQGHLMQEITEHHISDEHWRGLLNQARIAAAHGETEVLVLQFPAKLCSDGGRAINVPEPDWPATLRGEAAETYLRFERELRPLGFHLIARVMGFPGGFIGDIGLFLHWGGAAA
jgi:CBS domain-containing protein